MIMTKSEELHNMRWYSSSAVNWVLLSSTAGRQDLQGAGAATLLVSGVKTLLVWGDGSLLDPKPRRIALKAPTRLAPGDPIHLLQKPTNLPEWKIHLVWPPLSVLSQRAPPQSVHRNSRNRPVPLVTRRRTALLSRLHVLQDQTRLRLVDLIHHRAASHLLWTRRTPRASLDP